MSVNESDVTLSERQMIRDSDVWKSIKSDILKELGALEHVAHIRADDNITKTAIVVHCMRIEGILSF